MDNELNNEDIALKFYFFGLASLTKSFVFRSTARKLLSSKEFMPAMIMAYYSLFHLSISTMYFCPQFLLHQELSKLLTTITKRNNSDPSDTISHKAAQKFVARCEKDGLSKICAQALVRGKDIREFINYGPRMKLVGLGAHFETCRYQLVDIENFIENCDLVIHELIYWIHINSRQKLFDIAMTKVDDFLINEDLLYSKLCTNEVIFDVKQFILSSRKRISDVDG